MNIDCPCIFDIDGNIHAIIKAIYIELLNEYGLAEPLKEELWSEIEREYSKEGKHYHNLSHLSDLYGQLLFVKAEIDNWNVSMFTLFYHDIIYSSTNSDNEERSAELAEKRMTQIGVSKKEILNCRQQILATKSHEKNNEFDTNYFTDADLWILGRERKMYGTYRKNVRREYSIYPDFLYNKGRRKVINHFLSMDRIFKTEEFSNKYEQSARGNLLNELSII